MSAPRNAYKTWVYRTIMFFVHLGMATIYRTRVGGRANLPAEGGVLIASNHQSFLDIPLIAKAACPRHVTFVARDTLAESKFLSFIMNGCQAVLIKRGGGDRAALRTIAERLERGDCVAIFPEGTRTHDGRVGAFKKGALLTARMAGVPIVPCAIRGSGDSWPRGASVPRPTRSLAIDLAAPVDPSDPDALERVRGAVVARVEGIEQPDSDTRSGAMNS